MTLRIVAIVLALFAQTPRGSVEGVVLDSVAQKPIGGAQITLMRTQIPPGTTGFIAGTFSGPNGRPQNQTTTTDSDGRFRIADVEPGNYIVQAMADGYARQQIGGLLGGRSGMTAQAIVQAGATSKNIVLHLT